MFCVFQPPYNNIAPWIQRAYNEHTKGKLVVCLLPVRTSTLWFHKYALKATQIRFLKGHLKFKNYTRGSPFGCMIVIFEGDKYNNPCIRSANLTGQVFFQE
ncbi:MAG: DNA N-6-adenine-methyltransferase [Terriglobales bacterium]